MDGQTWATWGGVVVAGLIGWRGIVQAGAASTKAGQAVQLAESAENRADRLERIAIEHRDIEWHPVWDPRTLSLSFVNVGTDVAHSVELAVDLPDGGGRQLTSLAMVEPTQGIGYFIPAAVRDTTNERQRAKGPNVVGRPIAKVDVRLTWSSEAGAPGIATWPRKGLSML